MKRKETITLYRILKDLKNGNLSKDALTKYIMLRIRLREVFVEFEEARKEISEQTKPEGWKEGDPMEKWNENFHPVMEAWLQEDVIVDTKVFTMTDMVDFLSGNDLTGEIQDALIEELVKR